MDTLGKSSRSHAYERARSYGRMIALTWHRNTKININLNKLWRNLHSYIYNNVTTSKIDAV